MDLSKTVQDHRDHFQRLVIVLKSAGVALNLKKYFFFVEITSNLGHDTRNGMWEIAETMTNAILKLSDSTTPTEVRLFSSLCEVLRRFLRSFSPLSVPLNMILQRDQHSSFLELKIFER